MNIPAITTDQMREVDRLMIEVYGIRLKQMMEVAGLNLATIARSKYLAGRPVGKGVVVLCGSGGNGGGGMVAARHLHNWGAQVEVLLTKSPTELRGVPADQLKILLKMGLPVYAAKDVVSLPKADLILDAIIGYGLSGAARGTAAKLIDLANQHQAPILSLDTPSGLDSSSGQTDQPRIQAEATLTLALPKYFLMKESAQKIVGDLYLADISVPAELYTEMGLDVGPIFAEDTIIRIY